MSVVPSRGGDGQTIAVKVAFDSRPQKDHRGIGRYARCLLEALHGSGRADQLVETHDPRRCDVFHAPWVQGAMLRCPVPMVVTVHDLAPLKRPGEYLRSGLRSKLRYLAVQRAARVIVPTNAVADDVINVLDIPSRRVVVIPEAAAPRLHPRSEQEVGAVRDRFGLPDSYLLWVGGLRAPDPRKRVAALARTAAHDAARPGRPGRRMGPPAPRRDPHRRDHRRRRAGRDLQRRARTGVSERGRGLRPASGRGARLRNSGGGVRLARAARGARRSGDAAVDRGHGRTGRRGRVGAPTGAAPPSWTWEDAAAATWQVYAEAVAEPDTWRSPHRRHAGRLTSSPRAA